MVKASVFPGTPRAGYGPRRATLQEDRPGAYRDRRTLPTRELQASRHLYCACAAPTKGPRFQASSTGIGLRQEDKARTPGAVADHRAGRKNAPDPRRAPGKAHRDSVVTPRFVIHAARPGNEGGGSARRRHFPHASAQPRIRLAPSTPLLPCPQKNSCGTNVFGTSFPWNTHENPQQNLPDALTENRYFTRMKVY